MHVCAPLTSLVSLQEQQQALYQLMQQQDLQQLPPAQLPISSLLPGSQSKGQGAIAANPFLALQHAHADVHVGAQKPRLSEKALGVAGQEKT